MDTFASSIFHNRTFHAISFRDTSQITIYRHGITFVFHSHLLLGSVSDESRYCLRKPTMSPYDSVRVSYFRDRLIWNIPIARFLRCLCLVNQPTDHPIHLNFNLDPRGRDKVVLFRHCRQVSVSESDHFVDPRQKNWAGQKR